MPELTLRARRTGDFESRTEEYELSFAVEESEPETIHIKYQASRAYEINAALDAATEAARRAIRNSASDLVVKPSDEALSQLTWRAVQSVKYGEGRSKDSTLAL